MERAREKLRSVVIDSFALRDYGNMKIIVEVLEYILDRLEEAEA